MGYCRTGDGALSVCRHQDKFLANICEKVVGPSHRISPNIIAATCIRMATFLRRAIKFIFID
jgi:hypothetical protein